ncbi:TonB-dependent receptor domain-containing protein [Sphingomonas canadensis]|uniref:TonB-dependent receptor domain-containing protein n=1 Tax=Sphingomonas canadensis TaxID=1219257 RepID=A0ABW3H655_9SPHN|nr:TonB-dependent receptor [Sphingomonas canadensis]MCW3836587.1 TonB-dependent receptor [Sphingomonas canadensis]
MRHMLYAGAAVAALMIPAAASAQQITTGIEGTVTDESGAPIAGAEVTVTDTRTGATRTLTTGSTGTFAATNLVTGGPYTVTANASGFEGQSLEGIVTSLQGNTSLTFSLASGSGEIVVTGSRVVVAQLAVGPGQSFSGELLQAAPSYNRDIRDIIRIDPRVSLDRDDGGSGVDRISCLGGNDRGNAFTVDGISQGDIYGLNDTGFSSRSSTPLPYDAIRETQVQFAPFDVEYGQFTGCAINVVTKSGTNKFTGGGYFEYSDSGLRGDTVAGRPVAPIEPEKRWGAYLGGPIWKDKLFFFGAYEHQEAGQSQDDGPAGAGYANELAGVPVAAFNEISQVLSSVYGIETGPLVTSRPYKNDRYFGRVDWQISDQHRFEATYQRLEESTTRADDFFTGASSPQVTGLNTFYLSGTESNYYSGRLYSQWNDSFSTEIRYSHSDVQDLQDPVGGGEAQSANPIPRIIVGIDNATGPDGAVLAGPGTSRSANDLKTKIDQYRFVAQLDQGNHKLKLGAELNRADLFNLFVQNATGTLVFRNVNDLRLGLLSPGTGNNQTSTTPANVISGATEGAFGNFSSTGNVTDAAAAFTRSIYAIYFQDDWQATDRISLVTGARVEWYDGGSPKLNPVFLQRYGFPNTTGFSNLSPTFMPRTAITYEAPDFAFFSRTKVRAGVGVFSGGDPLVWFGNAFQNDGRGFSQGTSQDAGCPVGQISVLTGGSFTGVPSCIRASGIASAAAGLGDTQSISPDIKLPTVSRLNVGVDTELNFAEAGFFSGWHLNLDYILSRYINPLTLVDLSQTPDIRKGLSGYAIDGRPIYASLDPLRAGCGVTLIGLNPGPIYSGLTSANAAACFGTSRDDELMLTNARPFTSQTASFILSKNFDGGVFTEGGSTFFTLGFAYSNGHDRRNMYNSTAGSNYDLTAASDRQNPGVSRGFYSSKYNITLQTSFREQFFEDLDTRLSMTFVARSGRPYSLTFTGTGVFNDSASGAENALAYLPTGRNDPNLSPSSNMTEVDKLVAFSQGLSCASKYMGSTVPRNTCSNDWYFDMDLSFSQEIPGPGRLFGLQDTLRLYGTIDNFLNLLDSDWNVQHRRNFSGLQDVATSTGVDAQGRYIITAFNPDYDTDNGINVSSSVWRIKVGVSYAF